MISNAALRPPELPENVVLEFAQGWELEELESLAESYKYKLSGWLASRLGVGTKFLLSVTLRGFTKSELHFPETKELELESGVVYRLEILDKLSAQPDHISST